MADVKSVIKGTVNTVGAKAKSYVESGALKEAYLRGTTAARCYADIAKLNLQINGELEAQKDIFIEIGRAFYDENRGAAFGKYAAAGGSGAAPYEVTSVKKETEPSSPNFGFPVTCTPRVAPSLYPQRTSGKQ